MRRTVPWVFAVVAALATWAAGQQEDKAPAVPYVPTPPEVVEEMLRLAELADGDVVYDLGCGDARIVISALQRKAARGVCVEIDPKRIAEGKANAEKAGLTDRIRFVEGDLFEVPFEDATVVMLYLLPSVNRQLRPRLEAELKAGTRIVSHQFDMGDWVPEQKAEVERAGQRHVVYRWTIGKKSASLGQ